MHNGLLAAWRTGRSRIVTGPSGPTSLYAAAGPWGRVWSTHAVAAGYLALGRAEIDATVLPELLALGFVGGSHCLIRGVRAVPPATCIEVGRGETDEHCYWPMAERWATCDAGLAASEAEEALLRSLDARLRHETAPWLGLTAGLDSRVAAVAAARLGLDVRAFTWAHAPADAEGGRAIANNLGLAHETLEPGWHDEDTGLAHIDAEVRWTEGLGRMTPFGTIVWPSGMSCFLTGGAGEVGRAFWWRAIGRNHEDPDLDRVVASFRPDRTLRDTPGEVQAMLRDHVRAMLTEIAEAGVEGWALLDVLYGEQRLTRWGRGMLGRHGASTVAAFADPTVMARLAALPVEDRLTDGFHRYFLRSAGPLMPDLQAPVQRRGVPQRVRRLAAWSRSIRPRDRASWPWTETVARLPKYRAWLTDGVLGDPAIETAFGTRWRDHMLETFATEQNAAAGEAAFVLSGPVALAAAIRGLNDQAGLTGAN